MQNYYFYIYPDINGNYEVHTENCYYLPSELNRQYIGRYSSCQAAIIAAQIAYPDKKFDGCYHCGDLARLVQILQCHIVLNHTPRNLIA